MRYENVRGSENILVQRQNRIATILGGKVRGELIGSNLTACTLIVLANQNNISNND